MLYIISLRRSEQSNHGPTAKIHGTHWHAGYLLTVASIIEQDQTLRELRQKNFSSNFFNCKIIRRKSF